MRYESDDDELMDAGLLEPWLENWSFSISSVFTAFAVPTRRATQEGATNEMRHMHSTPPAALPTSPRASAHRCEVADPTAKDRRPTPSPPHRARSVTPSVYDRV